MAAPESTAADRTRLTQVGGLGVWDPTTPGARPLRPLPHDRSPLNRPNHDVKQKRSFHLSAHLQKLPDYEAISAGWAESCKDSREVVSSDRA